jgi:hypothetical protein
VKISSDLNIMFVAAIALAALASASAFAPSGRVATSALKMAEPFAGGLVGGEGPEIKKVSCHIAFPYTSP